MTELFLLGAGASIEAGIPGAYQMTKVMLEKFMRTNYPETEKAIRFVLGGLLFQQGMQGKNPLDGINIEELFNAVRLLGERQSSELAPFISSWHPHLDELAKGHLSTDTSLKLMDTIAEPIEQYLTRWQKTGALSYPENYVSTPGAALRFASELKRAVQEFMVGEGEKLLQKTAEHMNYYLAEIIWIDDAAKINYLLPLVEYAQNTNATIATLNYDNSVELAGQVAGVEIDIGFDSWSNTGEFSFINGKVSFLKLHGSIDWELSEGQTSEEKPLPFQVIQNIDQAHIKGWTPRALVFGGKNKLTAKGPFLSLLRSFDQKLAETDILTIIGYSLHDEHINEFIVTWFNHDMHRKIRVIDPQPENLAQDFVELLKQDYAYDRVQVIKETASNGISSLKSA
jgi:hypothetical protein